MKRLRSSFPEFLFVAFHEIGQPVDIVQFNERDALCAGDSFRQGGFVSLPSDYEDVFESHRHQQRVYY